MRIGYPLVNTVLMWLLNDMTCRYITSDCDAVATIYEYQHYVKTAADAVAEALKAGFKFHLAFLYDECSVSTSRLLQVQLLVLITFQTIICRN